MEWAPASGSTSPPEARLGLRVLPEPVWIERIRGSQRLNFDLLVENEDSVDWTLKFMGLRLFDEGKTIWTRRLDHQAFSASIATLGNTTIPPKGQLCLFNPFPPFDPGLPLDHLRCSLLLSTSAGAHAIRAVDIHPKPYQQHTPLQLPLRGRILVDDGHDYYAHHRRIPLFVPLRGGRMLKANFVRYGLDFVIVDDKGDAFPRGGGNRRDYFGFGYAPTPAPATNEGYFGFGAPILAPGEGVVIATHNDVKDNPPWKIIDQSVVEGNHVIIDHGHGEFSHLVHCQRGSVSVKPGDRVGRGQVIAKLGNSGDSYFPHLHYHVTSSADRSEGLPVTFSDFDLVRGSKTIHLTNDCPDTGEIVMA